MSSAKFFHINIANSGVPCTPLFLFPPYQKPPSNGLRQRRNPKKTAHRHRFAPTARCGKNRRRAVASPIIIGLRQRRNAKKTAEERFHTLARGWLAYPVTSIHSHLPPKSGCRNPIPLLANNLYNRSSAVDSSFHNQPQVGKPTWGYNYTTALRRLPHPSSAIPKNALRHRPPSPKPAHHHRFAPTAQCKKPPKSGLIR